MKNYKLFVLLLFGLLFNQISNSQTNPRLVNQNYMQTVFFDGFDTQVINLNAWHVEVDWKRDGCLNIFVDNPNTVSQSSGSLNLSMISSPGYTTTRWDGKIITADYIAGEVRSNAVFRYGSFECSAKYAYGNGSSPAFWIIGAMAHLAHPEVMAMRLILQN